MPQTYLGGCLLTAGIVLGLPLILTVVSLVTGRVSGVEFSPDTLDRRLYSYIEIPFLQIQVSPVYHENRTGVVEFYLQSAPSFTKSKSKTIRWHLVSDNRTSSDSPATDASILCAYFDATDHEGQYFWKGWSTDHPPLANILWPEVMSLARDNLYTLVPPLMRLARGAESSATFRTEMDRLMYDQFMGVAEEKQALERHEEAVGYLNRAISYVDDRPEAYRKRADSYKALTRNAEFVRDTNKANELEGQK